MPLLIISPTTCKMLATYHMNAGNPETEVLWLRVGITLLAVTGYNEGLYTETDMHGMFDLAQSAYIENVRERGHELLD